MTSKCRHLDNLLLQDDGRLFHVDFGFILGRDPKPFPPPMKLCKEMVEAMGGAERCFLTSEIKINCDHHAYLLFTFVYISVSAFPFSTCSQYYTRFKSYCCEAYNILRKSSNLILNLFHLMAGSNIPDIASDPEKGILKVGGFLEKPPLIFSLSLYLMTWFFVVYDSFKKSSVWT